MGEVIERIFGRTSRATDAGPIDMQADPSQIRESLSAPAAESDGDI